MIFLALFTMCGNLKGEAFFIESAVERMTRESFFNFRRASRPSIWHWAEKLALFTQNANIIDWFERINMITLCIIDSVTAASQQQLVIIYGSVVVFFQYGIISQRIFCRQ
jgi:hypothetical protein